MSSGASSMPRVRSPTHHIPILSPANSHTKTRELPGETASPGRLALTPLGLALGLPRQTEGRGVASLVTQGRDGTTGSSQFPERLALEEMAPTTSTRTRSLSCLGGALGLPEVEACPLGCEAQDTLPKPLLVLRFHLPHLGPSTFPQTWSP